MNFIALLRDKILDLEEQKELIDNSLDKVADGVIAGYEEEDVRRMNDLISIYEDLLEELEGGI